MTQAVTRWLLQEGRRAPDAPTLLQGLLPRLDAVVSVQRMYVGTSVLHPQAAAYAWVLEQGRPLRELVFSWEKMASLDDVDSPLGRLRAGAPCVRLRRGEGTDLPDVVALWDAGYTDFYAESLQLRGEWSGGFTFATTDAGGYPDDAVAALHEVVPVLSAVLEPLTRDAMYGTLLQTYLGGDAGRRVTSGQVRRGDGQRLRAAIWFSDVRGFTTLSNAIDEGELLSLLDDVFGAVVAAVQQHGGEVLKFIGDGALAIFPVQGNGAAAEAAACRASMDAALTLQGALATIRQRRKARNAPEPYVGVGLHFGDLMYGNIGAPTRLDFTVIGPNVNLAARVEGLCAATGYDVLATRSVARHATGWAALGEHRVKGVADAVTVFTPGVRAAR